MHTCKMMVALPSGAHAAHHDVPRSNVLQPRGNVEHRAPTRKHRYSPLLFLLASFIALTTTSCSGVGDCPNNSYSNNGPTTKAIPSEVTTMMAQRNDTTYNVMVQRRGAEYHESGCFLEHDSFEVDGPEVNATLPTRIVIYCLSNGTADKLEVGLLLPDLRNLSNGSFDLVELGTEWYASWYQTGHSNSCTGVTSYVHNGCTPVPTTLVTFGLTIDGAAGSVAASPANVSSDFHRTAHVIFQLTAGSGSDEMTINLTVPFEQTSESYLCAEEVRIYATCA